MLILVNREKSLEFAKDWIDPHIHHDLRDVMDLASVTVPLGLINEDQTSTAGTIAILNQCVKFINKQGVSCSIKI